MRCLQAAEFTLIVINSTVDTMPQEHQTIFNKRTRPGQERDNTTCQQNKRVIRLNWARDLENLCLVFLESSTDFISFNIQIDRTVCDSTDYRVSICFD